MPEPHRPMKKSSETRIPNHGDDEHQQRTRTAEEQAGRDGSDADRGAADCDADPHVPVSAVQYPVRIDGTDAPGRRLSVRFQIQLWLQPLFVAVVIAIVLRKNFWCTGATW